MTAFIFPRGWISGLTLSMTGTSSTFGVAAGQACDSTNALIMNFATAFTKTVASWAAGTGNGALDTGTIAANTWYHVHLIQMADPTTAPEILLSLSPTAPTLPANYVYFRRIGSMLTDGSSNWVKFVQLGDEFIWDVAILNLNNVLCDATPRTVTLSTPLGVQVWAVIIILGVGGSNGIVQLWVYSPDINVGGAQSTNNANANQYNSMSVGGQTMSSNQIIRTNTSSQIIRQSGISDLGRIYLSTTGWTDTRGRDL